jgi:hypothetical protein
MSDEEKKQAPTPQPPASPGNLWPESIKRVKARAAVTILKEQATLLGQRTQNVVVATVSTAERQTNESEVGFSLSLVAPALGNYTLRILTLWQKMALLYPVTIKSNFLAEQGSGKPYKEWNPKNEEEFIRVLQEIFNHPKVVGAIESIMAQSDGLEPDSDDPLV